MHKDRIACQHGDRNTQIPGQVFDIHIHKFAAGNGPNLEGQRHEHVIFPEVEQIAVGAKEGKQKGKDARFKRQRGKEITSNCLR